MHDFTESHDLKSHFIHTSKRRKSKYAKLSKNKYN